MRLVLPARFALAFLLVSVTSAAHADDRAARFASGTGTILFLSAGVLQPLTEHGTAGREKATRVLDSLVTASLITEGVKLVVRERRPDGAPNSFPSGHTTAAFAVATMQATYHPRQAIYWYLGAAAIGQSRVDLHRHYFHDVVAGAAVGYATAKLELRSRRGLLLSPWIGRDGGGVQLSARL